MNTGHEWDDPGKPHPILVMWLVSLSQCEQCGWCPWSSSFRNQEECVIVFDPGCKYSESTRLDIMKALVV